ncbi:MAG: ribonuclease D [Proteobacteria bacterium]|nr:ribonuclease D [Pseudomonadota bacterium]MBU1417986.1 ribonuclease D [Pseudomonadota bacterium]MBU1454522.1 ribonuclease D [Pseudomonadota bacterium]
MIDNVEDLQALVERARKTNAVALDTEFVWERTYYPRLGLIQLALSNEECFLIDPCALDDLSPLGELLADPAVVKIFHDAPQDIAILRNATGVDPKNIFDTRLAAGFAGLSSTLSLGALIELLLDIKLEKTETRTDWLNRPLHTRQKEYAMDDVRYLRAIRVLLLARIMPETVKWLEEELQKLNDPKNYIGVSDLSRYRKIRGASKLNRPSLAILQELASWREEEARKRNRPRGHIVRDSVLLCIARQQLRDKSAIQECGDISSRCVNAYGDILIQLVNKGLSRPEKDCPSLLQNIKLNKKEKTALTKLHDFIILKSDIHGIDPALVGNKSELKELVKLSSFPAAQIKQKSGWRRHFLAELTEKD